MSTTTTERTKAPSAPLLEPDTYKDQTRERLEQERTTISNRLSGLRTQIGRSTDSDRLSALERRQGELKERRDQLGELIKSKRPEVDTTALEELRAGKEPAKAAPKAPTKRDLKRHAQKAMSDAGVTTIAEETYNLLEALQGYPDGVKMADLCAAANPGTGRGAESNRMNWLLSKGLATLDTATGMWCPVREIDGGGNA